MSVSTPVIECVDLTFLYNREPALEGVTFRIPQGDYVGVIGSNGSGKTTLLKVLLGLLMPTSGTVKLFGVPIREFREWERIGYVPQNVFRGDMNFPATVREVVESGHAGIHMFSRFKGKACSEAGEALELVGMAHLGRKRIGELSGGERQRVFIARALVSHPELLVLDEPTTGIDAGSEVFFYNFLEKMNGRGMTILLVSHDLEAVAEKVKTVLCLNRRLVCFGPSSELQSPEVLRAVYGPGKHMLHHPHTHQHE